ncbi:hypothetical protein APHAL10511_000007 [Amanita phalloides]|nr:hypothetical protein APHAL10511_000007 [Amanita phalloides]
MFDRLAHAQKALNELKNVKFADSIQTLYLGNFHIYRVHQFFGQKSIIVKKINLKKVDIWNKKKLQEEVRNLDLADKLEDVLRDGEIYYILLTDLGKSWNKAFGQGLTAEVATWAMDEADKQDEKKLHMKRAYACRICLQ